MRFAKAHGFGNDFLLVPWHALPAADLAPLVSRMCDRHCGVGADGLVGWWIDAGTVRMRLFNADGSEAEISGNGLRCLVAWLHRAGHVSSRVEVETVAGRRRAAVVDAGPYRTFVQIELGPPRLASSDVPIALESPLERVVNVPLAVGQMSLEMTALSMGNPHCVLFADHVPDDAEVARLGSALERHPAFPQRCNVEFVRVVSPQHLRVRLWERGVGPTRSSGTGAASAAVAAVLRGVGSRHCDVECDGGTLRVEWGDDDVVRQTGEAAIICEGNWLAD